MAPHYTEIQNLISKVSKTILENEKFLVDLLAGRAEKLAQENPTDPTCVAMMNFLKRRSDSTPFITRADLQDAYNRLQTNGNYFKDAFAEELNLAPLQSAKYSKRDPKEGMDALKTAQTNLADPILSNALNAVFDKTASVKLYSEKVSVAASKSCLLELNKFEIKPKKIDVVAGQEDLLICQATFETPKGNVSVLIPIEVKDSYALLPTMMLTSAGVADLTNENIKSHVLSSAGKNFTVNAHQLLELVSNVKNGTTKTLSEVELIAAKVAASKGKNDYTVDGIFYKEAGIDPLPAPSVPPSEESLTFASKLATPKGAAELTFGKSLVEQARNAIVATLKDWGYDHVKVSMASCDNNSMYFAVAVDDCSAFKLPIKVANKELQDPVVMLANGNLYNFSPIGLSKLMAQGSDSQMVAVASPLYGLKGSELIDRVQSAVYSGNLIEAEDALQVLSQSQDEISYRTAFQIYLDGMKIKKEASVETQCSKLRKVAHSKYLICGHTNLPSHKVYQDQYGNCLPLYRKHTTEAQVAGGFMNAKILLG